jgi:hypothetical protein
MLPQVMATSHLRGNHLATDKAGWGETPALVSMWKNYWWKQKQESSGLPGILMLAVLLKLEDRVSTISFSCIGCGGYQVGANSDLQVRVFCFTSLDKLLNLTLTPLELVSRNRATK